MASKAGMWSARQEAGRVKRAEALVGYLEGKAFAGTAGRVRAIEATASWFRGEWCRAIALEKARARRAKNTR